MSTVYIGLVHYPIYNKRNEIVTTAITNFDIHDIARMARTYGVEKYFIIHPLESQSNLAETIIDYWQTGYGGEHHPDRKAALSIVELTKSIADTSRIIELQTGKKPYIITTDARIYPNTVSYAFLREKIKINNDVPCLILFGTGWGIENKVMAQFDYILEPIYGPVDYNHLPVRAAVSIILDRLLGENWWEK